MFSVSGKCNTRANRNQHLNGYLTKNNISKILIHIKMTFLKEIMSKLIFTQIRIQNEIISK